jgi:hypothetical protein
MVILWVFKWLLKRWCWRSFTLQHVLIFISFHSVTIYFADMTRFWNNTIISVKFGPFLVDEKFDFDGQFYSWLKNGFGRPKKICFWSTKKVFQWLKIWFRPTKKIIKISQDIFFVKIKFFFFTKFQIASFWVLQYCRFPNRIKIIFFDKT